MRTTRIIAVLLLVTVVAHAPERRRAVRRPACEAARQPQRAAAIEPRRSVDGTSPSADAAPSDGGTAVGEDCDVRQSEARDTATTLSLTWESINYQVLDDASWADQVAQDWVNAVDYRAATVCSRICRTTTTTPTGAYGARTRPTPSRSRRC